MTVYFRTSGGTDLDSLFYADNSYGGSIGFRTSSGIDLGNRYTNLATLGYAVGYRSSNGTDLGYLRGDYIPPSFSSQSMQVHQYYNDKSGDSDGRRMRKTGGYVDVYGQCYGSGSLTRRVQIWYYDNETQYGGQHTFKVTIKANSTENFYDLGSEPVIGDPDSYVTPSRTEVQITEFTQRVYGGQNAVFQFAYCYKGTLRTSNYPDLGFWRIKQRWESGSNYTGWHEMQAQFF